MIGKLKRIARRWREGTLGDSLRMRAGGLPQEQRVHWYGARSLADAAGALAKHGLHAWRQRGERGWVAVVGEASLQAAVAARLERAQVPHKVLAEGELLALDASAAADLCLVACTHLGDRELAQLAARLIQHPQLAGVPFEYAPGLDPAQESFERLDEYGDTFFMAPALHDDVPVYAIYEKSLERFEQKCGLRDYLDLYQMLRHVHVNRVPGAICEFGSFRGHSGWLISQLLQAMGSDKRLYMFDTFEKFPRESYGVDDFWSQTHDVNFDEVRAKFDGVANVALVKGDFTQTLEAQGPGEIAMAYVDCDSYRATRYLVQNIWNQRLSRNGAMVFEDYGHLALLGNRLAVHADVRGPNLGFQFFSQFSGFYIALKT